MTSTLPSAEEQALNLFASSTLDLLTFWPSLRLAISQGWGRSTQGRIELAEDLVDLFYTTASTDSTATPDEDDIESVLLHNLSHEFSLTLEDGSERLIARDLVKLWKECLARVASSATAGGSSSGVGLIERFKEAAEKARAEDGVRVYEAQRDGVSEDEEGSDDDEDEDEEMDGVEESGAGGSGSRNEPVIDDDGFELVQKGRR